MIHNDLPLLDLHRHIEGALRLETVIELADMHGIPLPAMDVEGLRPHVQVMGPLDNLLEFLAKFRWLVAVLVDLEACARIARECVEDASAAGLDYVELRFSPWFMAEPHGLDPAAVTEAVVDGVQAAARDCGLPVGLIGILSRTYGPEISHAELDALLRCRDHLAAVDLAGDELNFPPALFDEHFRRVRDLGLPVTVHAGEAAGAAGVRDAVELLGASRIGHCVRAIDDPALLDLLAERAVGIEVNLTSNVQTHAVESLGEHPMARFLEHGLLATLNTDDPTISGIDLRHEYEVAAPQAGLGPEAVRRAQANAVEIAYLSGEEKAELRRRATARA